MGASSRSKSSRVKVREHRARLRAMGLRPLQVWVPDTGGPAFKAQAHRQSLAVATSRCSREDQGFIDSLSDLDLDEASE